MEYSSTVDAIRSFFDLGGPVVAILAGISVLALATVLLKYYQFWRDQVGWVTKAEQAVELWNASRIADARVIAASGRSVAAQSVLLAIDLRTESNLNKQEIEEEVSRLAVFRLHNLQSGFRLLESIAQVAPLLGLFGTVLGMIDAFRNLQAAGSTVDPAVLAGGIWVALLTTAVGLAVAIPASLALTWFETRLENERVAIETLTATILSSKKIGSEPTTSPHPAGGSLEPNYAT